MNAGFMWASDRKKTALNCHFRRNLNFKCNFFKFNAKTSVNLLGFAFLNKIIYRLKTLDLFLATVSTSC